MFNFNTFILLKNQLTELFPCHELSLYYLKKTNKYFEYVFRNWLGFLLQGRRRRALTN